MTINHKRGDTFEISCAWSGDSAPATLTGCTITSQVRTTTGALVAALEAVERDNVARTVTMRPAAEYPTTGWPLALVYLDVQLTLPDGTVQSTDTVQLQIIKDITL